MKTQSINIINFKGQNRENKKTKAPFSKAIALALLTGMSTSCTNNSYINRDIFEKAQTEIFSDDSVHTQVPYLLNSTFMNIKDFKIKRVDDYNYTISMKDDDIKAKINLQAENADKTAAKGSMTVNGISDFDFKLKFNKEREEMFVALKSEDTNKTDTFFVKRYNDALKVYNADHKQIFRMPIDSKENVNSNKPIMWDLSIVVMLFAFALLGGALIDAS